MTDSECSDSSTIENSSDKDNEDVSDILSDIQNLEISKPHSSKKEQTEMTKVVVRRLPPNMTKEAFLKSVAPLPDYDYLYFVKPDGSNAPHLFSRAFINFQNSKDIFTFKEKFDNYIFLDQKGVEYPAVVEYSSFQRVPKRRADRKRDPKEGTIESDPVFKEFLKMCTTPAESDTKTEYGYNFESKKLSSGLEITPLVQYIQQKRTKDQKGRFKDDYRRNVDRKRIRDDERKCSTEKINKDQPVSFTRNREAGTSKGYHSLENDAGRTSYGETAPKVPDNEKLWIYKQNFNYRYSGRYDSHFKKGLVVKNTTNHSFRNHPSRRFVSPDTESKISDEQKQKNQPKFKKTSKKVDIKKCDDKKSYDDPRKQMAVRNKDRPDLKIYRPGFGRFSRDRTGRSSESNIKSDVDKNVS